VWIQLPGTNYIIDLEFKNLRENKVKVSFWTDTPQNNVLVMTFTDVIRNYITQKNRLGQRTKILKHTEVEIHLLVKGIFL
jgi:hypothetical protein